MADRPSRIPPVPSPTDDERPYLGEESPTAGVAARISLGKLFPAKSRAYALLLGTTLFLVLFGLIMVLSSSSVDSYVDGDGFFGVFSRQALFVAFSIPLMLVISRFSSEFWIKLAWPGLGAAAVLQLLVFTPLGITIGGNTNWVAIGPMTIQPAEFVKFALIIWLGAVLGRKKELLSSWAHAIIPAIPIGGAVIGIVMLGGDLGTVMIMATLLLSAMYFAGVKYRVLLTLIVLGGIAVALLAVTASSRVARIQAFASGSCTDYSNTCWQITHGQYALAAGGIFGAGLGNSKAKWSWLPAADNDFIFAIIGEELGLIGAALVLVLFVVMAIAFVMIIRRSTSPFERIVVGTVMVWTVGQALINIAVVLGLLPVLGVPLPLISTGGSALMANLAAIGVVLGIARRQTKTPESSDSPRQTLATAAAQER